ncbi:MAG: hypothetical protein JNN26_05105 [Candidatus Obscuribacter sp.]|nr:hypothetical protein [Candidatus Obscuribacter sp.]
MGDIFDQMEYIPPQAQGGGYYYDPAAGYQAAPLQTYQPAPSYQAAAPVARQPVRQQARPRRQVMPPVQAAPVVSLNEPERAGVSRSETELRRNETELKPGTVLSGGVESNNWFDNLPLVKDARQVSQTGDYGGAFSSMMTGIPAGPLEMADMGMAVERWLQDQTGRAVMQARLPQGLPQLGLDMVQAGVLNNSPMMAPVTDFAGAYRRAVNPADHYPGFFGGGAFIGQALVPAGTAGKGASLAQKLKVGAAGGAAMSGLFDVGSQYRDTGAVNPVQTGLSMALGAGVGAGGAGLVHGLEQGLGALARRFGQQAATGAAQVSAPAEQALATIPGLGAQGVNAVRAVRELAAQADMRNYFGRSLAETPEDALARIAALTSKPGAPPALASQPSSVSGLGRAGDELLTTMQAARNLDDIDTATEAMHRIIEASFKGKAKQEMAGLLSYARNMQIQRVQGQAPGINPGKPNPLLVEPPSGGGRTIQPADQAPAAEPVAGDFRRLLPDEFKGRNRNKLAEDLHGHPIYDRRPVRLLVNKFGRAKVKVDYTRARLDEFVKRYRDRFIPQDFQGAEYELPGGGKLRLKTEENASIPTRNDLAGAREQLETGVYEPTGPTISGTLSRYFGNGQDKIHYTRAQMPDDEAAAAQTLRELQKEAKAAEKAYEAMKPNHARQALEAAQAAYQRKLDEKGYQKALEAAQYGKTAKGRETAAEKVRAHEAAVLTLAEKVSAKERAYNDALQTQAMLDTLEQEIIQHTGDLTAGVHVRTFIPHPEEGKPGIEFALEYRKPTMRKQLDPALAGQWASQREGILRADLNRPRSERWGM